LLDSLLQERMAELTELAQQLVEQNCPLLHRTDSVDRVVAWLQGLPHSEERKKFLEWGFELLTGQSTLLTTNIVTLGLVSKSEAKDFLDGCMKGKRYEDIWNSIFSLISTHFQFDRTKDELLNNFDRAVRFEDELAFGVSFSDQLQKPLPLLDYQLEKDVAKFQSSSNKLSLNIIKTLQSKVELERDNLMIHEDDIYKGSVRVGVDSRGCSERLERFEGESGKLSTCVEKMRNKYSSELKPALKNKSTFQPADTVQVSQMCDKSRRLREFLDASQTTFNVSNNMNDKIACKAFQPDFKDLQLLL